MLVVSVGSPRWGSAGQLMCCTGGWWDAHCMGNGATGRVTCGNGAAVGDPVRVCGRWRKGAAAERAGSCNDNAASFLLLCRLFASDEPTDETRRWWAPTISAERPAGDAAATTGMVRWVRPACLAARDRNTIQPAGIYYWT
jgi:hypothetical protein